MAQRTQTAPSTLPLILPLHVLGRGDLAVAGGKGANLGQLMRAGFPVPSGFVVTTAAYDRFVAHSGLGETIVRALREEQGSGTAIREAFTRSPIPPEIASDILAAYRELDRGPVAVRSSATAEDLPEWAFAGQQDTFLNIVGAEVLLDAVRRCWASLWTDRAIAYRDRQMVDHEAVKLAVVVQRMVAAEVAGVMFTANPVTGERNETVINSSPGLGEAIVSGRVTPDQFVVRKRRWGWRITERRPGRHEVIIRARSDGGTEEVQASAAMEVAGLPDLAILRLAHTGQNIQNHFGSPQDIEWAWDGEKVFIVQARPMTALPEPPPHPPRLVQILSAIFAEMFSVRPYPLDLTTWWSALLGVLVPIFAPMGIAVPPFEQWFSQEDGVVVRFRGLPFHPTPGMLLAPLRVLRLARRYDPLHARADPLLADALSRIHALEARDLQALSWEDLLATVRQAIAITATFGEIRLRYFPRSALAAGLLGLALGLLRRRHLFGTLLTGAESKTTEANRALEELAERIRSDPTLAKAFASHNAGELRAALEATPAGKSFLAELQNFLDRYGHRETLIAGPSQPTWKDSPEVVLGILKGFAAAEPRAQSERQAWEVARDELLAHPFLRFRPLRAKILGLLTTARCFFQLREDNHFDATSVLPILRRTLLELGRRLVSVSVLDATEDVFHLKFAELERVDGMWPPPPPLADELRTVMLQRKEKRAALEGTPVVDPRLFRRNEVLGDALLHGTSGSPGVAQGPVRVIHDAAEFGKLRTGDVLVAPYTNPAWTPLFQRAIAVVVDSGAAGSHAAIVAREYGIPAVMGTIDGTRRLTDGQRVRVDGDRGLVFPAD